MIETEKISGHIRGLTPRKQNALRAVISCPTLIQAAKECRLDPSTLRTYWKDPEFVAAYNELQADLIQKACQESQRALSRAVGVLWDIAGDGAESGQTRVAACRAILDYGIKLTEVADLDARVTALEGKEA